MEKGNNYTNSVVNIGSGTIDVKGGIKFGDSKNQDSDKFNQILNLLNEIKDTSTDRNEVTCASIAGQYIKDENENAFHKYIQDNLTTFTTGTFSTFAGGLLLQLLGL